MTKTTAMPVATDLEQVRAQIERWRRTRAFSRAPMPEALWRAAVELCQEQSIHTVSQQLGLGYDRLRRKVAEAELEQLRATTATIAPEFVELHLAEPLAAEPGPAVPSGPEAGPVHELELVRPDGARLRLRTRGPLDLYELTEGFLVGSGA